MQLEKNELFRCYSSNELSCVTDIQVSHNKGPEDEFTLRFVGATVPEPYEDWTYEEDVHFYFDRHQINVTNLVEHFKIVIKRCLDYLLQALHQTKIDIYAERIAEYVNAILNPDDYSDTKLWQGHSCGYAMTDEILFQSRDNKHQFKYHITSSTCSDVSGLCKLPSVVDIKMMVKNFVLSLQGEHIYKYYQILKNIVE